MPLDDSNVVMPAVAAEPAKCGKATCAGQCDRCKRIATAEAWKLPSVEELDRRDALMVANRKLVFSQARKFVGLRLLTYDELTSEGDLALLRAARTWPGLGKFSTYAVTSIKRAICKALKRRKFFGQEP